MSQEQEKREPIDVVNCSAMDVIDAVSNIVGVIVAHMGACSDTLIPTILADVDRWGGLSDASRDFAKRLLRGSELSIKIFRAKADA